MKVKWIVVIHIDIKWSEVSIGAYPTAIWYMLISRGAQDRLLNIPGSELILDWGYSQYKYTLNQWEKKEGVEKMQRPTTGVQNKPQAWLQSNAWSSSNQESWRSSTCQWS